MPWNVGRIIGVYISERTYKGRGEAEEVYQRLLKDYEEAEALGKNWHPLTRVSEPWLYEDKEGDRDEC